MNAHITEWRRKPEVRMLSETLAAMRAAGQTLDEFLAQYDSPALPAQAPIPDLTPLSEALGRVGTSLQQSPIPPALSGPEKAEVDAYIDKVKRLKSTLENLQPQLEQRRDAVRARLGKIRAALDWVDSFNQTR
jgi:hypothetical protein